MKITSRDDVLAAPGVGSGPHTFNLTFEQAQLIAALLQCVRLGGGKYSTAAFEMHNLFDQEFDIDFAEKALAKVDFSVSVEDDDGTIVNVHHNHFLTIEV
jgi:hypothetical protein